ncbi:MAG: hypothetical protein RLZZ422_1454 [Pseudomonadota bacterium]
MEVVYAYTEEASNSKWSLKMTNQPNLLSEVGIVLSKRGKVTASQEGQTRILKRGDAIYSNDVVSTVRGANLQLRMLDNNIVMLRGGSTFRVNLYRMEFGLDHIKRFEYSGGSIRPSHRHEAVPVEPTAMAANI